MKALFVYSDNSTRELSFPRMDDVRCEYNKHLIVEPIIVYFRGSLREALDKNPDKCKELTRWQHWCLRQTRSYEDG